MSLVFVELEAISPRITLQVRSQVQYLMLSFPRGAGTNNNLLVAPFAAIQ